MGASAKSEDENKDVQPANGHAGTGEAAVEQLNGSNDQELAGSTEDAAKQNGASASAEASRKRTRSVSMGEADKEGPPAKRIPVDASAQPAEPSAQGVSEVIANGEKVDTDAGGPKEEKPETVPITNGNGAEGQDVEMKEEEQSNQPAGTERGESSITNGTTAVAEASIPLPADGVPAEDGVNNAQVQTNDNDLEQGPDSRSRSGSVSSSAGGNEEGQDQHRPLVTARLAPSIQRIASPQSYIESLFVTPHDITVPIVAGASAQGAMEGMNSNTAGGAAGIDTIKLTPNEQLETVRLCLGELTKFLADSLEYQDRLGEIRDSVLGIERRRKGVWNMARGYAHQMLWEEEQDKLANGV